MKKALKAAAIFMSLGAMVFLFAGCDDPASGNGGDGKDSGNVVLSGDISINPVSAKIGTQLTADYSGTETVLYYHWKRDGISVGANSNLFTADTAGVYTVTVSGNRNGNNPKTSGAAGVYAMNGAPPIITSRNTADPSAHFWDGRLYLYPSTDRNPANNSRGSMDRYHVYSTNNMVDWIDHGEILRRDNLPVSASVGTAADGAWGPHHANAYFMSAPDAAQRAGVAGKGPYFFYFPHALDSNGSVWTIGVAWSDKAYTGFKDNVVRLKNNDGSYVQGDGSFNNPCIFQDGNDYYLVTGGSGQLYIAKLSNDMVSLAEPLTPYSEMSELTHYSEGPWMFARENKYYLVYSGNPGGNDGDELLYAVGDTPYGPWSYQGSILDPSGTGSTSQGSVVEFSNKWYLFYHNAKLSEGNGNLRSVCVNELSFNEDGMIRKAIQTTAGVARNGQALNTGALNSQFGTGNYTVEVKYSEIEGGNYVMGFELSQTISVSNSSVTVGPPPATQAGGGAYKGNGDFSTGAVHGMDRSGAYVQFNSISGNGEKAGIRLLYACPGDVSLTVTVNGVQTGRPLPLTATGGWNQANSGESQLYEVTLNNNNSNTIRLSANGGVNIANMYVYMEKD